MNIIKNRKDMLLNVKKMENDGMQNKITKFISVATIVILACIIVVTLVLIFDISSKMRNSKSNMLTYERAEVEEPMVLRIGL